jgi:hypothetical protein
MRKLIAIALAQFVATAAVQAETTSFTSDTVVISYDAADLQAMQSPRGSTSSFYSNYIDFPIPAWSQGRNAAYIQAMTDGTQFVTPPIAVPPGATISYQIDYASWFPLNSNTIPVFYNQSAPFFLTMTRQVLTSCNTSSFEVQENKSDTFRRVYASTIYATNNPLAIGPKDRLMTQQAAIVERFKPASPSEYASNSAVGIAEVAESEAWQNTSMEFACNRLRLVFPRRLDLAVYKVNIIIRN